MPAWYTALSVKVYAARVALFFAVAGFIILSVAVPAAARYMLIGGMLVWGVAMAAYWFHPVHGLAAGPAGVKQPMMGWVGAIGLNLWFTLAVYWVLT